jgi:hypothetical protein
VDRRGHSAHEQGGPERFAFFGPSAQLGVELADCDECDAWFEANQPAEGTPEREEWDEMAAAFFKAYNGHRDEIYSKNMNRAQ